MKAADMVSKFRPYLLQVQTSTQKIIPYWIAASITALVSVAYARLFGWSEKVAFSWYDSNPALAFVLIPLALLASAVLVQTISPFAGGSGIPQLLAAVEISDKPTPLLEKLLNLRMILIKFLGSCVCVAGGGVIGREGPMLQISAGVFHLIQKLFSKLKVFPTPVATQPMILAGGAAGLASAFNTPLGGIIFAIEELAKVHVSHIRTYVFHAVIIAGILAQAILGNYLYFGKLEVAPPSLIEIFPLIFASALIGIAGAVFGRAIVALMDWRSKRQTWEKVLMTLFMGLLVATISYFYGRSAIGSGRDMITHLVNNAQNSAPLSLGFVRGLNNLFSYCGGVVGGIFAPALSTGGALGSWASDLFPQSHHEAWILGGMIAFLTGLTRTPFTSLILVLEMTDTHNIIISLMLSAIIAQSAAKLVSSSSFYEQMAHRILHGRAPDKDHS